MLKDWDCLVAHYSSGQENEYFGWRDATGDTVQQLAERFTKRFPEILAASRGDDWSYAGWYVKMLGYAEREMFPIAYADSDEDPDPRFLPLCGHSSDLPMPPPGDADDEGESHHD